jgi:cellulose synthase/poly-beta-1,6-N-acetylglucosamine synthase-like glycosyltransferase
MEPTLKFFDDSNEVEVHMFGNTVAVCWNMERKETKEVVNGRVGTFIDYVRKGSPYIDFVEVRECKDGDHYLDEDCPIVGGIDSAYAKKVLEELQEAIYYLEKVNVENKISRSDT